MVNFLDRFQKSVIGTTEKLQDYIDVIAPTGDFLKITGTDVIVNSWLKILLTPTRSEDHDPEYGCDIYKKVWEPQDDTTMDEIRSEISSKLKFYDNRGNIKTISVQYLANGKGFVVNIVAEFNNESGNVSITINEDFANIAGGG